MVVLHSMVVFGLLLKISHKLSTQTHTASGYRRWPFEPPPPASSPPFAAGDEFKCVEGAHNDVEEVGEGLGMLLETLSQTRNDREGLDVSCVLRTEPGRTLELGVSMGPSQPLRGRAGRV